MVVLEDDLERTSKYIKKWAKRFVSFDEDTRKISYGTAKDKIKSHMAVTKVTRLAEQSQIRASSGDLFAVHIEGTGDDGKPDTWTVRMPDLAKFNLWYTTMRNCLAAQGLMDPLNFGLPDEDPRNGLSFVTVPLEHLHKFALLEKAILYYFGLVTMHGSEAHTAPQEHIVMIGDRNVYIFRPNADVLRCVPIEAITSLQAPEDPNSSNAFAVISPAPTEHDIVLKASPHLTQILQIIADVYKGIKSTVLPVEKVTNGPIEQWIETKRVQIRPLEGYKMKAMSPTPKSKLKIALDLYQQQHGSTYSRSGPKRSKADKAAALASAAAAAAASGGSGGAGGGSSSTGPAEADTIDDSLSRLLKRLGLTQYTAVLRKQHVDADLLTCMDPTDLTNFGVKDPKHCDAILQAAQDREANGSPSEQGLTPPTQGVASSFGGAAPSSIPQSGGAPAAPQAAAGKKMVIVLDSDDDEDLMPVMNNSVISPASPVGKGGAASPLSGTSNVVILDDSDDDLMVAPQPKPSVAAPIILDDDDI